MNLAAKSEWIADLEEMTCRNINNRITVSFIREEDSIIGKIKEVPSKLMNNWTKFPNSQQLFQKTVAEAEKEFIRAYKESDYMETDDKGIGISAASVL